MGTSGRSDCRRNAIRSRNEKYTRRRFNGQFKVMDGGEIFENNYVTYYEALDRAV